MPELKPRYAELSDASGLFTDQAAAALRANPLQQLWREHLLAQSMIDNGLYDEGYLVMIAPTLNYHAQDAAEAYHAHLREPEDGKVRFVNLTLEELEHREGLYKSNGSLRRNRTENCRGLSYRKRVLRSAE